MNWPKVIVNPGCDNPITDYHPIIELYLAYIDKYKFKMKNNKIYIMGPGEKNYDFYIIMENNYLRFPNITEYEERI